MERRYPISVNGKKLDRKEEIIVFEAESEFRRASHTNFLLIFPNRNLPQYKNLFNQHRPLNTLLWSRMSETK